MVQLTLKAKISPKKSISRRDSGLPPAYQGYRRGRGRNRAERMFAKLRQRCGVAIRHNKSALQSMDLFKLATAWLWRKLFVNAA